MQLTHDACRWRAFSLMELLPRGLLCLGGKLFPRNGGLPTSLRAGLKGWIARRGFWYSAQLPAASPKTIGELRHLYESGP